MNGNIFDEVVRAAEQAEALDKALKSNAGRMAKLLRGRLRAVAPWIVADLKRELRDFNLHTKEWKP